MVLECFRNMENKLLFSSVASELLSGREDPKMYLNKTVESKNFRVKTMMLFR